jgi:hypothetical protein
MTFVDSSFWPGADVSVVVAEWPVSLHLVDFMRSILEALATATTGDEAGRSASVLSLNTCSCDPVVLNSGLSLLGPKLALRFRAVCLSSIDRLGGVLTGQSTTCGPRARWVSLALRVTGCARSASLLGIEHDHAELVLSAPLDSPDLGFIEPPRRDGQTRGEGKNADRVALDCAVSSRVVAEDLICPSNGWTDQQGSVLPAPKTSKFTALVCPQNRIDRQRATACGAIDIRSGLGDAHRFVTNCREWLARTGEAWTARRQLRNSSSTSRACASRFWMLGNHRVCTRLRLRLFVADVGG